MTYYGVTLLGWIDCACNILAIAQQGSAQLHAGCKSFGRWIWSWFFFRWQADTLYVEPGVLHGLLDLHSPGRWEAAKSLWLTVVTPWTVEPLFRALFRTRFRDVLQVWSSCVPFLTCGMPSSRSPTQAINTLIRSPFWMATTIPLTRTGQKSRAGPEEMEIEMMAREMDCHLDSRIFFKP